MKSEKDWETDSSDDNAARPGPSKKRKRVIRIGKNKKRKECRLIKFYLNWRSSNSLLCTYRHMLKYKTLFEGVFRAKVSYFGENFYVR